MQGKLSDDIREFLVAISERDGYGTNDLELLEVITECGKEVHRSAPENYRWWSEYTVVVELEGKYIAYLAASASGDFGPEERGWEMDLDVVRFVHPVEKTVIVYE